MRSRAACVLAGCAALSVAAVYVGGWTDNAAPVSSPGHVEEQRLKDRFVVGWSGPEPATASISSVEAVGDRGYASLAPDGSSMLALENNPGMLSRLDLAGRPSEVAIQPITVPPGLAAPTVVRTREGQVYVKDSSGLLVMTAGGRPARRIPLFFPIRDLAVLSDFSIAFNPLSSQRDEPMVIRIDERGRRRSSWGGPLLLSDDVDVRRLSSAASISACHGRVAVAAVHAPRVFILPEDLSSAIEVRIPFPGERELEALAYRRELTRPRESVLWLPSFLAGITCVDDRLLVLLDLPAIRIVEVALDGRVMGSIQGPVTPYTRFHGLVAHGKGQLYALALGADRRDHLLRLDRHR